METLERKEKNTHQGLALKRFRRTLGMSEEAVAAEVGISAEQVKAYESQKEIEATMLQKFADVLGVTTKLIENYEEKPAGTFIENNTFENNNESTIVGGFIEENTINNNITDSMLQFCEKLLDKREDDIELIKKMVEDLGKK